MISPEEFDEGFGQVMASFNRNVTKENRNAWRKEVYKGEPDIFAETMQVLAHGERFPSFMDYVEMYHIVQHNRPGGDAEPVYCGLCFDGWIRIKGALDTTAVAVCAECFPHRRGGINPRDPNIKWESDPAEYNKPRKQLSVEENKANAVWIVCYIERQAKRMAIKESKGPHEAMREQLRQREGFGVETGRQ